MFHAVSIRRVWEIHHCSIKTTRNELAEQFWMKFNTVAVCACGTLLSWHSISHRQRCGAYSSAGPKPRGTDRHRSVPFGDVARRETACMPILQRRQRERERERTERERCCLWLWSYCRVVLLSGSTASELLQRYRERKSSSQPWLVV